MKLLKIKLHYYVLNIFKVKLHWYQNQIGQQFLFGEVKKQLKSIKIEVLNVEITYLEPKFKEVKRTNSLIDKEKN